MTITDHGVVIAPRVQPVRGGEPGA
jgi:hypothetical protein